VHIKDSTFGAYLSRVQKIEHFGKLIRSTLKVLRCGAAEGWRSDRRSCDKYRSVTRSKGGEEYSIQNEKG
jgi:hypothetical protein